MLTHLGLAFKEKKKNYLSRQLLFSVQKQPSYS